MKSAPFYVVVASLSVTVAAAATPSPGNPVDQAFRKAETSATRVGSKRPPPPEFEG